MFTCSGGAGAGGGAVARGDSPIIGGQAIIIKPYMIHFTVCKESIGVEFHLSQGGVVNFSRLVMMVVMYKLL